jgi:uncharacterized Ntn-hydrolase superfamily protein
MKVSFVLVAVLLNFSCSWAQGGLPAERNRVSGSSLADSPRFRVVRPGTMSIIARDPQTGELGVAVESHYFSVGPICPWAEAGVGAIATQAMAEPLYGQLGLEMMRYGKDAPQVLKALLAVDSELEIRQVAMIDVRGNVAVHTGSKNTAAAGHLTGKNYSVQANTMSSERVWPAMARAFEQNAGDLADRLLAALEAGQKEGGDLRGQQTAAIIVVSGTSTGRPWKDRIFDLRVEDSPEPITELKRLVRLQRAYRLALKAGDLISEKNWDQAIGSYRKAVEMAPEKEELRYGLATTLLEAGRDEESLPLFRQVFREHPTWVEITKRYVISGELPNDSPRIQRVLDQARMQEQK